MKFLMLVLALFTSAIAQVPTGTVTGVVRDPSGAPVARASLKIVNLGTNQGRMVQSSEQGTFGFPSLMAGEYEISVEAEGFPRLVRAALVEAGATTTADFTLRLGDVKESVTVDETSPQIRYDSHSVGGVITRSQIQNLPLNGRSFLELAKLEPGVQPPSRTTANRTFVPVLGAPGGTSGRGTRVTIDGGSVMTVGFFGSSMNFSQDVVQEFQISTANFDLSTGTTFSGAVNVATRSGGNELHGSGFYFFRDHKLSAYPVLIRDPANPDPFFQRRQFGFAAGGPIRRDRVFFFGNWERTEQRAVATNTLLGADFGHLSRITPSPLFGNQFSVRLDARISAKHTAFLRHSHDGSRGFNATTGVANANTNAYPSNWVKETVWADQSLLGLTTVVRPTLVNDLRFSYFFFSNHQVPSEEEDCPGCLGNGAPSITIRQVGLVIGRSNIGLNLGRRLHLNDSVAWQRGTHRARFGIDWEHNRGGVLAWGNEPVTMTLYSPDQVRTYNRNPQTPAELRIPLPASFNTLDDILRLPIQTIMVGIGDPRVRQANGSQVRRWDTARLYFQDTWRMRESFTLNYGLAWTLDGFKNYDLDKPAYLAPILGAGGLGATRRQWKNFSPALGLAWAPSQDKKTVIRAGAGIYYDYFFQNAIDSERAVLGPPGSGRLSFPGSSIRNPLGGIPGVPAGSPLNFPTSPTLFTGINLMSILPAIRANLSRSFENVDPMFRSVEVFKQATTTVFPVYAPNWSAQHGSVGFQRAIVRNFVLSADFVFRHFIHGGLGPGGLDLNRWDRARGPVIPKCIGAQADDPRALCSTGPIQVWQATSNQTYKGLLVRADKRFSHRFQLLGSYAWSSNVGTPGSGVNNPYTAFTTAGLDLDNWHQKAAPLPVDYTHIANIAAVVQLPWRFDLGMNLSLSSAPPFAPVVNNIDFNGDGTKGDLLPGTTAGQFNRGLGSADLVRLVDQFNQTYANTRDPVGSIIPKITLPANYSLDDAFQSLDLRLSRTFVFSDHWRLSLIGEVFNVYNAANLSGYSSDLTNPAFGQPTARFTQLFGSGGPRAFQVAIRVSF